MSTPFGLWTVKPSDEIEGQVAMVDGDMLAVRVPGPHGKDVIVPMQLGAVHVYAGYESAWAKVIASRLAVGTPVRVTWIAGGSDQLMLAMVEDRYGSLDASAIAEGWAMPTTLAMAVPNVRATYRTAVEAAARNQRGIWNDSDVAHAVREEAVQVLGKGSKLSPTYFSANPGLSIAIILVFAGFLAWAMKRENDQVREQTKESGLVGKGWWWIWSIHTRFIPRTRFPGKQQKEDEQKHA